MTEIVGVGFVKASKTYYFDPEGKEYKMGELVIVETARGLEMGHISIETGRWRTAKSSHLLKKSNVVPRRPTWQSIGRI